MESAKIRGRLRELIEPVGRSLSYVNIRQRSTNTKTVPLP